MAKALTDTGADIGAPKVEKCRGRIGTTQMKKIAAEGGETRVVVPIGQEVAPDGGAEADTVGTKDLGAKKK